MLPVPPPPPALDLRFFEETVVAAAGVGCVWVVAAAPPSSSFTSSAAFFFARFAAWAKIGKRILLSAIDFSDFKTGERGGSLHWREFVVVERASESCLCLLFERRRK